ncbi:phosphatidylinositol 4-kinase B [Pancytospora philotis]|nr:phosphatidylinositol 4-kinase B [Pancytospora philotis]
MHAAAPKDPAKRPPEAPEELLSSIREAKNNNLELLALLSANGGPGIHHAVCRQLERADVSSILPQLIQVMLSPAQPSLPIYSMLVRRARRSVAFQTELFLALKGILSKADESKASFCYFLCCDLFGIAKARENRNLVTLARNHRAAEARRRARAVGRPDIPQLPASPPGTNEQTSGHGAQSTDADVPDISQSCSKLSLRSGQHKARRRQIMFRTQSVHPYRPRTPSFSSLVLSFARAVSSLADPGLFKSLNGMLRIFNTKKNFKSLQMNRQTLSPFKRSVLFYDMFVGVSNRVRLQPQALRQRSLEAELEYLNLSLTGPVLNPFDPSTAIVSVAVDECFTLDSAEYVPYLIVAEVVSRHAQPAAAHFSPRFSLRTYKASVLQSHLSSINELNDVGDINGIKENILEALELVLFDDNRGQGAPSMSALSAAADKKSAIAGSIKEDIINIKNDALLEHKDRHKAEAPKGKKQGHRQTKKGGLGSWSAVVDRVKQGSAYTGYPGWSAVSFIVKSGSILRQEYLAYQIITQMKRIFEAEGVDCFLRNYKIYLVSETAGLIETVTDAYSIHKIKSKTSTLVEHFSTAFKDEEAARGRFLKSLAGYSLASYLLQLKDRHNGNILIDAEGHMVHVDFGFILGSHPGFYCVENAPFKFSHEYLELVKLADFKALFHSGFCALRKHHEQITRLVEIMESGGMWPSGTAEALTGRFNTSANEKDFEEYCSGLVDRSINSIRTVVYDRYQYFSNGYY